MIKKETQASFNASLCFCTNVDGLIGTNYKKMNKIYRKLKRRCLRNMCSNCNNNIASYNNRNLANEVVGIAVENGNNTILGTNTCPHSSDVLGANINQVCSNTAYGNDILGNSTNNYNGNINCSCNANTYGCNCNGCNDNNNSYVCNCNNNTSCNSNESNIASNNDNTTRDSLQRNLRNFIGRRVTVELNNCGTCNKKTGVLTCVGCNFLTLRGINNNNCLLIDTAGLTSVTIHN